MEATKKKKKRDPRIGGPGDCAICGIFTGRKLTISKFFRWGPVPAWAVVHPGCNRLESRKQFLARMERLRSEQAVGATERPNGERAAGCSTAESSGLNERLDGTAGC